MTHHAGSLLMSKSVERQPIKRPMIALLKVLSWRLRLALQWVQRPEEDGVLVSVLQLACW
jgi:hypothetical protein